MAKLERQPDSLFRPIYAMWRQETYTFRPGTQEQRPELSDSRFDKGCRVNARVGVECGDRFGRCAANSRD